MIKCVCKYIYSSKNTSHYSRDHYNYRARHRLDALHCAEMLCLSQCYMEHGPKDGSVSSNIANWEIHCYVWKFSWENQL